VIAKPTSWPAPVAFDDALSVALLIGLTGDRDAAIFALRLWHHRRRIGAFVPGPDAEAGIEVIAGGGSRRRGLAAHLISAGLVEVSPGGLTIRPWEESARVDWTRSGGLARQSGVEIATKTPSPKTPPSAEALRKWEKRHPGVPHPSVAGLGPDSDRTGVESGGQSAGQSGQSADGPVSVRADSSLDPRARTCATVTSTVTVTGKNEEPSAAVAAPVTSSAEASESRASRDEQGAGATTGTGSPPPGKQPAATRTETTRPAHGDPSPASTPHPGASDASAGQGGARDEKRDTEPADPSPAAITEVLTHWRAAVEMPKAAIEGKAAEKRRLRVRARLAEGFTVADLKAAASHVVNDSWLWGRKQGARSGGWRDVETVFRDAAQVERLRDLVAPDDGAARGGLGRMAPYSNDIWENQPRRDDSHLFDPPGGTP
jgi:hypothetical protein